MGAKEQGRSWQKGQLTTKKIGTNFWNSSCFGNEMIWSEGECRLFIHNWLWRCVELSLLVSRRQLLQYDWTYVSMEQLVNGYIYIDIYLFFHYIDNPVSYDCTIWFVCWVMDSYYSLAGHCHTLLPEMMNPFGVALQNIRRCIPSACAFFEQINCSTLFWT